ncbi:MAG: hypothetical protein DHS20C18_14360 [Saprospiraceae bacterium]|nr:MAG: hypothetical protein DHS20C18_14360 [Saprospiraceae bacterium]
MLDRFRNSIVKIVNKDNKVVGTGFVVHKQGYILTTSQVILDATLQKVGTKIPKKIEIEFVGHTYGTQVQEYFSADILSSHWTNYKEGDIAVLHFNDKLPEEVEVLPLGNSLEYLDKKSNICFYGFPNGGAESLGRGQILGRKMDLSLNFEIIQIAATEKGAGFMGGPVLNLDTGHIIGLYSQIPTNLRAFIVPSETIKEHFRLLELQQAFSPQSITHLNSGLPDVVKRKSYDDGPEENFLATVKSETIVFLETLEDLKTKRAKEQLLRKLDLIELKKRFIGRISSKQTWEIIIDGLQYNKIDRLIELLKVVTPDSYKRKRKNEVKKLINKWETIEVFPYRYIFHDFLKRIVLASEYIHLDRVYIDLIAETNVEPKSKSNAFIIEQVAVEQSREEFSLEKEKTSPPRNIIRHRNEREKAKTDNIDHNKKNTETGPRVDQVLNIAKDEDRFVITGAPGSGKTVTLKKIAFRNAEEIIDGQDMYKIPILIIANQFNKQNSFESLIAREFPEWNNPDIDRGHLLVLIDGFNEINPAFQEEARAELKTLLEKEEDCSIIISSRKYGFDNIFQLPHFEIKELRPVQVKEYIGAYLPQYQEEIWAEIMDEENEQIKPLAYNPLTLFMIIFTFDPESKTLIPDSRGRLFGRFISKILDWKKSFSKSNIESSRKEKILSKLALIMRKQDFNPPEEEVEAYFTEQLGNEQDARDLLDDLYINHILKINFSLKFNETENQFFEEKTVSFMHESFLEYFCSLELKEYFIQFNNININFGATEWFETILMVSDLFKVEERIALTKFLLFLYFGGEPKKVRFLKAPLSGKRSSGKRPSRLDPGCIFYSKMEIACKTAYNIKNNHPEAYGVIEFLLIKDLKNWVKYQFAYMSEKPNENELEDYKYIPSESTMKLIFAAVGGLSSKEVYHWIFKSEQWQMIWLIQKGLNDLSKSVRENLNNRIRVLIDNLSDFETLYDYLDKFGTDPWVEDSLAELKSELEIEMPLKLQKRLFEANRDTTLLKRIGKQDPEYYMENFDLKEDTISSFVNFLLSLAYNDKVQTRLLHLLFSESTKPEVQIEIARSLIEKFYCVEEVLRYISKNYKKLKELPDIADLIRRYLRFLPFNKLPSKLRRLFIPNKNDLLKDYLDEYQEVASSSNLFLATNHVEYCLVNLVNQVVTKQVPLRFLRGAVIDETNNLSGGGTLTFSEIEDFEVKFVGAKYSSSKESIHLMVEDNAEGIWSRIPKEGEVIVNNHIRKTIKGIGNLDSNTTKTILVKTKGTLVPKGKGSFFSEDGLISHPYLTSKTSDDEITIYYEQAAFQEEEHFQKGNEILIDGHPFRILDWGEEQVNYQENVFTPIRFPSGEQIDSTKWFIHFFSNMHPDIILNNEEIINDLNKYSSDLGVRKLISELNLLYLFHEDFEEVSYGIILKKYPALKKVVYYSNIEKRLKPIFLPDEKLMELKENQIVVVEKDDLLHAVKIHQRSPKTGFAESFITKIKSKNYNNQYAFIFNPDNKDFFLHSSRINFFPKDYDRVSFFPCLNFTKRYRNFPIARKVVKIEEGNESQKLKVLNDYELQIRKHRNALNLYRNATHLNYYERENSIKTALFKLCDNYFKLERYEECLKCCNKLLEKDRTNWWAETKAGDCCMKIGDYQEAINRYNKVKQRLKRDPIFVDNLACCYVELGRIKFAQRRYSEYDKHNEINDENFFLYLKYLNLLVEFSNFEKVELLLLRVPEVYHEKMGTIFERIARGFQKKYRRNKQMDALLTAFSYFDKAQQYSSNPSTIIRYAIFLYQLGDFDMAEKYRKEAFKKVPDPYMLKLLYSKEIGKIEHIYLDEKLKDKELVEKINLAERYLNSKPLESIKLLKALKKVSPKHPKINTLIRRQLKKFKFSGGIQSLYSCNVYDVLHNKYADEPKFNYEYANYLNSVGKLDEAIALVKKFTNEKFLKSMYFSEFHRLYGDILKKMIVKNQMLVTTFSPIAMEHFNKAIDHCKDERQKMDCLLRKAFFIIETKMESAYEELDSIIKTIKAYDPFFEDLQKIPAYRFNPDYWSSKRRRSRRRNRNNKS